MKGTRTCPQEPSTGVLTASGVDPRLLGSPVHWKQLPGKSLCNVAQPRNYPAMPGEWLTNNATEVDCPTCLEWMHA